MLRLVTLRLYERRLDVAAPLIALPAGVELGMADRATVRGAAEIQWHPEVEQRLRDGQQCAVARRGQDVIAYCWLASKPVWVGEIEHAVVPGPDEVYLYDAFTLPEWRGQKLFSALLAFLIDLAHRQDRKRALIFVDARNRPSRRAIERVGFELAQTVSRMELAGLSRVWFGGLSPGSTAPVNLIKDRRR